jgi:hypothetical protein
VVVVIIEIEEIGDWDRKGTEVFGEMSCRAAELCGVYIGCGSSSEAS